MRSLAEERLLCSIFPSRREKAMDWATGMLYRLHLIRLGNLTDRGTMALVRRRAERNVRR